MQETIELLNDIFESEVSVNDIDKEVHEVLLWDSFHIMDFLVEMEERFEKRIKIEDVSEIYRIRDLIQLIEKQMR